MLGPPLGTRAAHIVQLGAVGVVRACTRLLATFAIQFMAASEMSGPPKGSSTTSVLFSSVVLKKDLNELCKEPRHACLHGVMVRFVAREI
jgi:hypothetical protein